MTQKQYQTLRRRHPELALPLWYHLTEHQVQTVRHAYSEPKRFIADVTRERLIDFGLRIPDPDAL